MDVPTAGRAVRAATSVARRLGMDAREHRVLNSSNRLVLHVLPGDAVSARTAVCTASQVPSAQYRRWRFQTVFHGPYCACGRSRQGTPVRYR